MIVAVGEKEKASAVLGADRDFFRDWQSSLDQPPYVPRLDSCAMEKIRRCVDCSFLSSTNVTT